MGCCAIGLLRERAGRGVADGAAPHQGWLVVVHVEPEVGGVVACHIAPM